MWQLKINTMAVLIKKPGFSQRVRGVSFFFACIRWQRIMPVGNIKSFSVRTAKFFLKQLRSLKTFKKMNLKIMFLVFLVKTFCMKIVTWSWFLIILLSYSKFWWIPSPVILILILIKIDVMQFVQLSMCVFER